MKVRNVFVILLTLSMISCRSIDESCIKKIKNPKFQYGNEVLKISDGNNEVIFNNVKRWNLSSENKYDYYVTEDNSKCLLIQTFDKVVIDNTIHTYNKVAYYMNFNNGYFKKIDDSISRIAFSDNLDTIVYFKNYNYTNDNKVTVVFYNTNNNKYTEKLIDFSLYGTDIEKFPLTSLSNEKNQFWLYLWSDAIIYGKINLFDGKFYAIENQLGYKWITEDPARDGTNWYGYCGNNQVMFMDRKGFNYNFTISNDKNYD